MKINGRNYNFNENKNDIKFDELGINDSKLKNIFNHFDLNKDGNLSANELKKAFNIFSRFDNTDGTSDATLSDDEIKNGILSLPKELRVSIEAMKDFIIKLTNLNQAKNVASNLKTRIYEWSFSNKNTLNGLEQINSENVVEVIEEYKKLSSKETLASAIDNEIGLDVEDVKKYICKPLAERAKRLGIKIVDYNNISDIKKLNNFINTTLEKIKTKEASSIKTNFEKAAVKSKEEICQAAYEKWTSKSAFKKSPLKLDFFKKLYDVMKLLNVTELNPPRNDGEPAKSDSINYESDEEKLFDQFIAIFAGEAQLNPKSVFYGSTNYYGLFQVDAPTLQGIIKWAKRHPDVPGMKNIESNMTVGKFVNLPGERQLDYFVAYIRSSKEGSNISETERLSPAKIWSMIKLPNLPEDNPDKLERRNTTIEQKVNAIDSIVGQYCQQRV